MFVEPVKKPLLSSLRETRSKADYFEKAGKPERSLVVLCQPDTVVLKERWGRDNFFPASIKQDSESSRRQNLRVIAELFAEFAGPRACCQRYGITLELLPINIDNSNPTPLSRDNSNILSDYQLRTTTLEDGVPKRLVQLGRVD